MAKPQSTTLLLDADVIAYQAAQASEVATEWTPGHWTWHCSFDEVAARVNEKIERFMDALKGDSYRLCLSCPDGNFRKAILPTYKGNRSGTKRPLVLEPIREWMVSELGAWVRPGLEGDDLLGIFSTSPHLPGRKIIVSLDKDMRTIPGLFVRRLESGIEEVSAEEADTNHFIQTLTGDVVDGYSGCPGIGAVKAAAMLRDKVKLVSSEHALKRGPRKGQTETRWNQAPSSSMWDTVLSCFLAAGLTEEDALQQARVARILRDTDYDFQKKEPILWTPTK